MTRREEIISESVSDAKEETRSSRFIFLLLGVIAILLLIISGLLFFSAYSEQKDEADSGQAFASGYLAACEDPEDSRTLPKDFCEDAEAVLEGGTKVEPVPGPPGKDGEDGLDGENGLDGEDGQDGKNGPPGPRGGPGADGDDGTDGQNGPTGPTGTPGLSAYQVAVANGFAGTVSEWLNSLVGANGADGQDGRSAFPFTFVFTVPGDNPIEPDRTYTVTCEGPNNCTATLNEEQP